ncbi:hypothetical protein PoB_001425600 [Plakobranchus ocellatus]|uniref:Uncharacterized protein n=1 Tax=Plakobranchus ocellatus TaxID=259542 RepID=A0AAV3YW83_9GAST|nr:hypothetical protein PoB_001425600 [Plakobranchus ocellatus]
MECFTYQRVQGIKSAEVKLRGAQVRFREYRSVQSLCSSQQDWFGFLGFCIFSPSITSRRCAGAKTIEAENKGSARASDRMRAWRHSGAGLQNGRVDRPTTNASLLTSGS